MSVRIIVREVNIAAAANVGGPVETRHRVFEIEAPELEAYLFDPSTTWNRREIVGVEERKP